MTGDPALTTDLKTILSRYLPLVEEELREVLLTRDRSLSPFYGMMHYHLGWVDEEFRPVDGWGGKRLRPALCLLANEAAGGDFHQALPAAAAVEIVHNFSLAHDDIEDGDDMRRHRRTLWRVWGVPQALTVGDGLFALAHLALERLLHCDVSPSRFLRAMDVLDRCCVSLIEGQYLDLSFEERAEVHEREYLSMVGGKTAALLGCATELGALLATDDEQTVDHFRRFGQYLGFAFQMADDVLGIWGDPLLTGKPAGSDIVRRKKTLPVVYALERSSDFQERHNNGSMGQADLGALFEILDDLDARAHAERLADDYTERALRELEQTGLRNEAQERLRDLAAFLAARSY
jgi:geranylgeranyl diphosphate synthase type I